jgi:membrane protease YdiL (CAAX protease family)
MNPSRYFLLDDGRLRAGWRLLLFVVFCAIALVLSAWLLSSIPRWRSFPIAVGLQLFATAVTTWVMLRVFDHRPFHSVGLDAHPGRLGELCEGLAAGIVLVEVTIACEWATGLVVFEHDPSAVSGLGLTLVSATAVLFMGAASEELLFRGYAFQRLVEGCGVVLAIGISSVIFGYLHLKNPSATILSTANTVLAGILLSLAYVKTRGLWFPIGIHLAWNWAMALSGFPVSGLDVIEMPWRAVPASAKLWLHGGDYGPEGGAVATGVLVLGTIWLLLKKQKGRTEAEDTSPANGSEKPGITRQT